MIAVDMGIKYNQVRCLVNCDSVVKVVPWDYDFVPELISKGEVGCSILWQSPLNITVLGRACARRRGLNSD